jgi:CRISPR/Cas system endoribonuclease Cas6 (RAMP superfamily)
MRSCSSCAPCKRDRLEQYLQDDGIILVDYDLKAHAIHFPTHQQQGFVGRCIYALRGLDEAPTPEMPLTVRQRMFVLAQVAFYCGVGYKTAMGMGQTRLV